MPVLQVRVRSVDVPGQTVKDPSRLDTYRLDPVMGRRASRPPPDHHTHPSAYQSLRSRAADTSVRSTLVRESFYILVGLGPGRQYFVGRGLASVRLGYGLL
jgi:hypothetical protein